MRIQGKVDCKGKFWAPTINYITDEVWSASKEARLFYSTQTDSLWYADSVEWKKITHAEDVINDGQKMLFLSYPLPDSWTVDTTHNEISVLTSTTEANAGSSQGSWTITGMSGSEGVHNHSVSSGNEAAWTGVSEGWGYLSIWWHYHFMSKSETEHTHSIDVDWKPKYVYVLKGIYSP